jgi:IclR family KDG regulon transcriptional repressor
MRNGGEYTLGNSIGTVEKAVDILCLFSTEHTELSALEIAGKLGMPLSTAYKYLQAFQKKQFLQKNETTNKFYPGLSILKLGMLAAEKTSVIETASPYMKSLVEHSLETAFLTVLDGLNVVCVDVRESPRVLRFTTRKGSTLPLYAGAPGKAVLAFKDQSFIDYLIEVTGLVKLNRNTITDIEQLKNELAAIRVEGLSRSDSEYSSDVCSMAAPIFDHRGEVIASLSLAGPAERIFGENQQSFSELVKESARGISTELVYVGNRKEYF